MCIHIITLQSETKFNVKRSDQMISKTFSVKYLHNDTCKSNYNTDLLQRVTKIVFPFCNGMRGSSVNGG
jgi:hypothetical protein